MMPPLSPRHTDEIPGFPWTDELSPAHPRYPTGQQVQAYLQTYARSAGLEPLITRNAAVRALRPLPAPAGSAAPDSAGWELEWEDTTSGCA